MNSYLKFLSRNKLYTAIEAVGLAVSLAFVIIIGSYVVQQFEVKYENPNWRDISGYSWWPCCSPGLSPLSPSSGRS